jgi:hypothetical protein
MTLRTQFILSWVVGFASLPLARWIGDGFLLLALAAGLWMLLCAVQMLTDSRAWPYERRRRMIVGTIAFMFGSGWCFGGLVGLLAILGVEASS